MGGQKCGEEGHRLDALEEHVRVPLASQADTRTKQHARDTPAFEPVFRVPMLSLAFTSAVRNALASRTYLGWTHALFLRDADCTLDFYAQ